MENETVIFTGIKISDDNVITSPYNEGFRRQLTHMENIRLFPPDDDEGDQQGSGVNWDEEFAVFVKMWGEEMRGWDGGGETEERNE